MSTRDATPGHGGKPCARPEWWKERTSSHELRYVPEAFLGLNWVHDITRWERSQLSFFVPVCPACGIELTQDEEPLPVPKGAVRVEAYDKSMTSWALSIRAYDKNRNCLCVLCGNDPTQVRTAWRRAFGKEGE